MKLHLYAGFRSPLTQNKFRSVLFTALALTILSSCHNNHDKKSAAPISYPVLTLSAKTADTYSDYPATIQGQQVIEIRPKVDGYVQAIYVNEGATVKKGQLLFKISNPQFDQGVITARAAINIATADVSTARMNVEKVRPLVEKQIVSEYELQSAQYALQSKQAALAQAQATLANAQTNLGYTTIRSPAGGVIGEIPYKIGALVNSTTAQPLTTLSNSTNVYTYFSLNEISMLRLLTRLPGNTLEEKLNQIPPVSLLLADGSTFPEKGKLETASGLIATETGTESFKAVFPNPGAILRSGASATVRIPRHRDTALLVPQSATYELQDKRFVYRLTPDNKVISTTVDVTPSSDGQFFIVNKGLAVGDRVVLNGLNINDSTSIKPLPVNTDSVYHISLHQAQP